jgi:hypothetical protein
MIKLTFTALVLFYCISAFAQKTDAGLNPIIRYAKSIVIGSNYTYIWDTEERYGWYNKSRYAEHTIAANVAFDFSRHFRVGVDFKNISTKGVLTGSNKYALLGMFMQYKFGLSSRKKDFVFADIGYYKGNYCTCGRYMPYKKTGVRYLNWGGGYNFKISKNVYADLAFTSAQVLNKVFNPYAYTQYIIGIDYALPLKSNK